jgi:hypothetical protein
MKPEKNAVPKHTPTPWWRGTTVKEGLGKDGIGIVDGSGKAIALVSTRRMDGEANGEYIIQAVNAHEDLLKAAKDALGRMEATLEDIWEGKVKDGESYGTVEAMRDVAETGVDILQDAIRKAEGKNA